MSDSSSDYIVVPVSVPAAPASGPGSMSAVMSAITATLPDNESRCESSFSDMSSVSMVKRFVTDAAQRVAQESKNIVPAAAREQTLVVPYTPSGGAPSAYEGESFALVNNAFTQLNSNFQNDLWFRKLRPDKQAKTPVDVQPDPDAEKAALRLIRKAHATAYGAHLSKRTEIPELADELAKSIVREVLAREAELADKIETELKRTSVVHGALTTVAAFVKFAAVDFAPQYTRVQAAAAAGDQDSAPATAEFLGCVPEATLTLTEHVLFKKFNGSLKFRLNEIRTPKKGESALSESTLSRYLYTVDVLVPSSAHPDDLAEEAQPNRYLPSHRPLTLPMPSTAVTGPIALLSAPNLAALAAPASTTDTVNDAGKTSSLMWYH